MGFVYTKEDERVVLALLWVLTAFLAVCIVTKIWTSLAAVRAANRMAEAAIRAGASSQDRDQKDSASGSDVVEQLRHKNLFVPRPPKQNPIVGVTGILGSEALINGRWYRAGDMMGEARVLAIEATYVRVQWDGKMLVYSPIQTGEPSAPDALQGEREYTASAERKPAQEKNLQTQRVTAPYARATGRSEGARLSVDASQSREVFSPGLEKPFRGPPPEMMATMRQMMEAGRLAESRRAQQQTATWPVTPR
jgi:hypothetical protein